ncbi:hypothetical protein [Parabacteroides goldsteinii]|jgi:hypothetical protein|uniref:hypothetical protein n=1 Tax=Parabacteroides goldsteinii TaxID=328812 RepID=UPI0022E8C6B6|nr:hypothetical protein [Parabacteroides goldsteinii]
MELSVLDRVIITKALLPETGTIEQIKLVISLKNKIGFSREELQSLRITSPAKGVIELPHLTEDMKNRVIQYFITPEELELLKLFANAFNQNGWVTPTSLDTIEYLLNN